MMTKFGNKESIQAISVATGRDPKTIRKVVTDPTPPTAPPRRARGSKLDPYASYLAERWDQGCHNAQFLWEELRQRGFTGSLSLGRQSVAPRRSQRAVEPTPGFETEPGEQKQCDLAVFGRWCIQTGPGNCISSLTRWAIRVGCLSSSSMIHAKTRGSSVWSTRLPGSAVSRRRSCRTT